MSFDKRDYLYNDTSSSQTTQADEKDSDEEKGENLKIVRDRVPREWVQELLLELQDISKNKGVNLLDVCSPQKLALFLSRYHGNTWRY